MLDPELFVGRDAPRDRRRGDRKQPRVEQSEIFVKKSMKDYELGKLYKWSDLINIYQPNSEL